jgi:alpha-beta hydrolase superfamily lysophospholipase
MKKQVLSISLLAFCLFLALISHAVAIRATKPGEAKHKKGKGRLITAGGYKFPYRFYPTKAKGASVIYIPGMGGRVAGRGKDGYALAKPLNKANFNFIGFDRAGALSTGSQRDHIRNTQKRGKSGSAMFPSIDGKESAAENIFRNEVSAVIEFVERAPTHDPPKGIYLIGGSFGSWISLVTVHSCPQKIKGVIFLSPAILPEWVTAIGQDKQPGFNVTSYFKSLIRSFGQRPALAIGSKNDIIAPHMSKHGSALDGAQLLRKEIGPNLEVMEVSTSLHSFELVADSRKVRKKIMEWLTAQVAR